jgi:hypothetical protein
MTRGQNAEGYPDPTASIAIGRVAKEERMEDPDREAEYRIKIMTKALKAMARGFGFEVTNRVEFKDKTTGKEYK